MFNIPRLVLKLTSTKENEIKQNIERQITSPDIISPFFKVFYKKIYQDSQPNVLELEAQRKLFQYEVKITRLLKENGIKNQKQERAAEVRIQMNQLGEQILNIIRKRKKFSSAEIMIATSLAINFAFNYLFWIQSQQSFKQATRELKLSDIEALLISDGQRNYYLIASFFLYKLTKIQQIKYLFKSEFFSFICLLCCLPSKISEAITQDNLLISYSYHMNSELNLVSIFIQFLLLSIPHSFISKKDNSGLKRYQKSSSPQRVKNLSSFSCLQSLMLYLLPSSTLWTIQSYDYKQSLCFYKQIQSFSINLTIQPEWSILLSCYLIQLLLLFKEHQAFNQVTDLLTFKNSFLVNQVKMQAARCSICENEFNETDMKPKEMECKCIACEKRLNAMNKRSNMIFCNLHNSKSTKLHQHKKFDWQVQDLCKERRVDKLN